MESSDLLKNIFQVGTNGKFVHPEPVGAKFLPSKSIRSPATKFPTNVSVGYVTHNSGSLKNTRFSKYSEILIYLDEKDFIRIRPIFCTNWYHLHNTTHTK